MADQVIDYVNAPDAILAERVAFDEIAFEILYERYFGHLYGFVFKRVGHREIVEDLVSMIFTKVFIGTSNFKNVSFKAWIYKIATNTVIDYYRKNKNHFIETLDDHIDTLASSDPSPEDLVSTMQDSIKVHRALADLGIKDQELLHLRFFADLSYEEIAGLLKSNVNNVRVSIHRALKKFKKAYEKF